MSRNPVSYPKDLHGKAKADRTSLATIDIDGVYESDQTKQVRFTLQFPCSPTERDELFELIEKFSNRWNAADRKAGA